MKDHGYLSGVDIQCRCIIAIADLSKIAISYASALVEAGACEAIIATMLRIPDDVIVQTAGCHALTYLVNGEAEAVQTLNDFNIARVLINDLKIFSRNPTFIQQAYELLTVMLCNESVSSLQDKLASTGACETLTQHYDGLKSELFLSCRCLTAISFLALKNSQNAETIIKTKL